MNHDIRLLNKDELTAFLLERGEKPFRYKQIEEWLWKKAARSFDDMTNLPAALREELSSRFTLEPLQVHQEQYSIDGTIKYGFKLSDGNLIEGVLIPANDRYTACVSSQSGCSLSCKFCATGYLDRKKNLTPGEIYDQVVAINRSSLANYDKPLSNIVFMGMGEPLLNYKHVMRAIDTITSPWGLAMSPRRITVSTAGIAKMISKLGDEQVRFNLALSLHAANDAKRNEIMPINETNNLEALIEALNHFYKQTKNIITFEYILLGKFNDSYQDAKELAGICKKIPSKVNIIEYNPIDFASFQHPGDQRIEEFAGFLVSLGVDVNVRRSRGKDIDAACGQLANK